MATNMGRSTKVSSLQKQILRKGNYKFESRGYENAVVYFKCAWKHDWTRLDIQDYVKQKMQDTVTLEIVQMKMDKGHNAIKVLVSKQKFDMFLNHALWPEGISFRKFISFKL